jgi:hypothetical protein
MVLWAWGGVYLDFLIFEIILFLRTIIHLHHYCCTPSLCFSLILYQLNIIIIKKTLHIYELGGGGSVVRTGGSVVRTGGSVVRTGGSVVHTGGSVVRTGGSVEADPFRQVTF